MLSRLCRFPLPPRHFHGPNAERPHVADGAVVLLLVVRLGGLVAQPRPLVHRLVDALGRGEGLHIASVSHSAGGH